MIVVEFAKKETLERKVFKNVSYVEITPSGKWLVVTKEGRFYATLAWEIIHIRLMTLGEF